MQKHSLVISERTPEIFRRLVLDRLLDDPALTAADSAARRQILEAIAAIGPVVTENDELLTELAKIVNLAIHEVRRLVAVLERTQFLMRRGRLVRVSPDVLADHLLYRAAVDENGNRQRFLKDPDTRKRVARPNPQSAWIVKEVPELRIIDEDVWKAVRARYASVQRKWSAAVKENRIQQFRRPKYLFSGLTKCGECGAGFIIHSRKFLGCFGARDRGTCSNRLRISRLDSSKSSAESSRRR